MLLRIDKVKIPIGQAGTCGLNVEVPDPKLPLPLDAPALLSVKADVKASDKWSWGGDASAKLSLDAQTRCSLAVLSAKPDDTHGEAIKRYGLADFLSQTGPVLLLEVGGDAKLGASGSFRYGALKAGVTLKAGAEGCAGWARPFDPEAPSERALKDFFGGLVLPADMAVAPAPGEVTLFEYSGDLKLGASVSAGLEVKGTASSELSRLKLAEHYKAAALGKLAVSAGLSGLFSVEVRQAAEPGGKPMEGWARVIVKKSRSKTFTASADLSIGVQWQTEGLPTDPEAFFGALLGVEAGNWVHWADRLVQAAGEVKDPQSLVEKVDGLGRDFLKAWLDKELPELLGPEGQAIQSRIRAVVDTYDHAQGQVLAVVDGYLDQGEQAMDALVQQLQEATSWKALQGRVNPQLWDLVNRLTDGDPLGWTLKKIPDGQGGHLPTLDDLKALAAGTAAKAKALLQEDLGGFLRTAKAGFGLDPLLKQLGAWDSKEEMAGELGSRAGHFLGRIVGENLDTIPQSQQQALFERLKTIREGYAAAKGTLATLLATAAKGDFEVALGAAYARSDERDALVDVAFNMAREEGKALFRKAVLGDFAGLLSGGLPAPGIWRINKGAFTRKLLTKRSFKFNIMGWHDGYHYQSTEQLLLSCSQHITAGKGGAVLVQTRLSAEDRTDKIRPDEERHAKFALVLAAVTRPGAESLGYDRDEQAFLVQGLQAQSSSYALLHKDQKTSEKELREYLAFAGTLGLGAAGATFEALAPLMQRVERGFGAVQVSYQVRFKKAALQWLFAKEFTPEQLRQVIGELVLARFAADATLAPMAWAFYFHLRHEDWEETPNSYDLSQGVRWLDIPPKVVRGLGSPKNIVFGTTLMPGLVALYEMESDILAAWISLSAQVRSELAQKPGDLLGVLRQFFTRCKTLGSFARIDNFLLAFFDGLAALGAPEKENRASSLEVSFTGVDGAPAKKKIVFALALEPEPGEDPDGDPDENPEQDATPLPEEG